MPENNLLTMQFIKKNILSSILMGALFVLCPLVIGQTDTKQKTKNQDNDAVANDTIKREYKHSPQLATLSSAIIPGLGQAYNRKYWKVPLIWGAGLALYTYYDFNNSLYHRFKLADEQYDSKNPSAVTDPDLQEMTSESISQNKDFYRRHRDRAVIFMGLLYVANIVDAMVDAHLLSYDISQDLSLHWQPTIIPPNPNNYSTAIVGVNVQLKF